MRDSLAGKEAVLCGHCTNDNLDTPGYGPPECT